MKKRQVIIIISAIAILAIAKLVSNFLASPKEKPAKVQKDNVSLVFSEEVKLDSIPIFIESTGLLKAVKRLELYSEVQGLMEDDQGRFKAGNSFDKGDLLIQIRSQDQRAQLYAQRSSFQSTLAALMPDLKADYPDAYQTWDAYLKGFDNDKMTMDLPEVKNDKLKTFLIGRGLYSNYYTLKNLEIINQKYSIRAPYDGVLIQSEVDPGTVIRNGQLLGVFIQPNRYELEVSIDAASAKYIAVGQEVKLSLEGEEKSWTGRVNRLVKAIEEQSQMSTFFVEVKSEELKEGMFLKASVEARSIPNAFSLNRAALVDQNQVYVVQADTLATKDIELKHLGKDKAIISGLKNGEQVLTKVPPSAFPGMKVAIYE